MTRRWLHLAVHRDTTWVVVLALSFALALLTSWERWADPIIDVGREMNQPLRLLSGEDLYSDVRHIYGPFSPWFHAGLYRLFGPSLSILYADGIVTATIVLGLVYWLGRQVMGPAAAGAATLHVMSLCLVKPSGNYVLPYSYNALHGSTFALATLALLVATLQRMNGPGRSTTPAAAFALAGVAAGLSTLAKTEMGIAAVAAGIAAALLAGHPDLRRGLRFALVFAAPVAILTMGGYALVAQRVGWSVLWSDSWLLFYNIPQELVYFNKQISGFGNPLRSLERMLIALVKVATLAGLIAVIGARVGKSGRLSAVTSSPRRMLASVIGLLVVMGIAMALDRDKGPYLAMPFLLIGFLAMSARELVAGPEARTTRVLLVMTIFALASLARMILHVRSGGAYASYVLPVSIVLFTYMWVSPFAGILREARPVAIARGIAVTLIALSAAINSCVLAYRYQTRNTVAIATDRGRMIAKPDMAQAINEALLYIDRATAPGDAVAVLPEGTAITFLSGRRNPLREEIITPGYLDAPGEARAIRQLRDARTRLILVPNRPTREFGPNVFGRDYNQGLMQFIEANYSACAIFGPVKDRSLTIGDPPFFIRAYCLASTP